MNRDHAIALLRDIKSEYAQTYGIEALGLFGSTARGEARPDSGPRRLRPNPHPRPLPAGPPQGGHRSTRWLPRRPHPRPTTHEPPPEDPNTMGRRLCMTASWSRNSSFRSLSPFSRKRGNSA